MRGFSKVNVANFIQDLLNTTDHYGILNRLEDHGYISFTDGRLSIDKNKHENLKVLLKSFPEIPSTCEKSALVQQDARNFIKVHQYEFIALSNQMWDKLMEHVQDKRNKQLIKLCTELEGLFKTELVGMCLRLSLGME